MLVIWVFVGLSEPYGSTGGCFWFEWIYIILCLSWNVWYWCIRQSLFCRHSILTMPQSRCMEGMLAILLHRPSLPDELPQHLNFTSVVRISWHHTILRFTSRTKLSQESIWISVRSPDTRSRRDDVFWWSRNHIAPILNHKISSTFSIAPPPYARDPNSANGERRHASASMAPLRRKHILSGWFLLARIVLSLRALHIPKKDDHQHWFYSEKISSSVKAL